MTDPRLRRGALLRLCVVAVIGVAAFFALFGPAHAQGRAPGAFVRIARAPAARGGDVLVEASRWVGSGKMTRLPGPWCADAISFWLRRTGHRPLAGRMASDALRYGPRLSRPTAGALAVISTRRGWAAHVGIVEGVEPDGSILLISGNWGHRVARAIVPRWEVIAFVRVG